MVVQYGGLAFPWASSSWCLLCLAFAVFPLLFGLLMSLWLRAFGPAALLAAPLAWVATELLRAHTFFEFPWCLLGYSQQGNPAAIQIAAWTAVYGVSAALVLASALVAYAVVVPARAQRALVGLGLVVAGLHAFGLLVMRTPLATTGRMRVGLVQGGIVQEEKWKPELAGQNIDRHLELTREAAQRGARLVVWPESAVPFYYDHTPALAEELRETVRRSQVYLLFGNDDLERPREGGERAFVGAKMLSPRGELVLRYHKIQLVPFGEYVPLQALLTLGGRVVRQARRAGGRLHPRPRSRGGRRWMATPWAGSSATRACSPTWCAASPPRGRELLVNMTNDAWYGRTSAPYQHLAMSAFRAVENRRTLVRAANTGITAIVDPWGRVRERTALFDRTVLVGDVDLVATRTFYSLHGDVFAGAALGADRRPHRPRLSSSGSRPRVSQVVRSSLRPVRFVRLVAIPSEE